MANGTVYLRTLLFALEINMALGLLPGLLARMDTLLLALLLWLPAQLLPNVLQPLPPLEYSALLRIQ